MRLALAVGLEASARAGADPAALAAVFTSSGGDGQNCHEICQVLASAERHLSPTRFHNSVHNAAAGYWGIATGATPASNALCAYDASFGAGLLEALTQVAVERTSVLLIAYDASAASQARLSASLTDAPADGMTKAALDALRLSIPAARSLPLLAHLARRTSGRVVLDYLDSKRLAVDVSACR